MICINDSGKDADYNKSREEIIIALEKSLPYKSPFEKMNE